MTVAKPPAPQGISALVVPPGVPLTWHSAGCLEWSVSQRHVLGRDGVCPFVNLRSADGGRFHWVSVEAARFGDAVQHLARLELQGWFR